MPAKAGPPIFGGERLPRAFTWDVTQAGQLRWVDGIATIVGFRHPDHPDHSCEVCLCCKAAIPRMMPQIWMCDHCEKKHWKTILRMLHLAGVGQQVLMLSFLLFDRAQAKRMYYLFSALTTNLPWRDMATRLAWPKPRPPTLHQPQQDFKMLNGERCFQWERFVRNTLIRLLAEKLLHVEQYLRARSV